MNIERVKEIQINAIGLTPRASNALRRAGFRTIGDVISTTYDDIIDITGFGAGAMKHLVKVLSYHGVNFLSELSDDSNDNSDSCI